MPAVEEGVAARRGAGAKPGDTREVAGQPEVKARHAGPCLGDSEPSLLSPWEGAGSQPVSLLGTWLFEPCVSLPTEDTTEGKGTRPLRTAVHWVVASDHPLDNNQQPS